MFRACTKHLTFQMSSDLTSVKTNVKIALTGEWLDIRGPDKYANICKRVELIMRGV